MDDSAPVFSADGAHVLFLRERQVHRVALSGGVAERLTSLPHGVDAFALSPDGRRLLLTGPAPELRFAVGQLAGEKPPLARVLRRVDWRLDGSGILDRHAHLWVAPARPGGRARRILTGDLSAVSAVWSPDGTQVAYVSDPDDDADLHQRTRVFTLLADGTGEPVEVGSLAGACRTPAWSPDGTHIAFRGIDEQDEPFGATRVGVGRLLERRRAARSRAGRARRGRAVRRLGSDRLAPRRRVLARVGRPGGRASAPSPSVAARRSGGSRSQGDPSEQPGCGAHVLRGVFESGMLVLLVPGSAGAAELAVGERAATRRLTRHGSAWARPLADITTEQIDVPGPAGPIRTWVVSPADAEGPLPTVLSIIGGPGATWGPIAWLPDLALADRGYRVLRPDPRGSGSYGRAWTEAILGSWGGADAEDQLAVCDWAVAEGLADPDRLAVHGLSYGGYMTNWLVGQTDRFRAAVSANGVSNQVSAVANCDLGLLWTPRLGWEFPPDGIEQLWAQSPLAYADRITTPLLMLQGADDLRCPAADNEQLFSALRVRGREVEYVLYPEESHAMQGTGRPDRRIDMLERTFAWLERFGCAP